MAYLGVDLKDSITLGKIFSIHYFEYMSDFSFVGESHDFWEFICVDKGEVYVTRGDEIVLIKRDDIVFHKPNEFHNVKATGRIAPNLVVCSFECHDPAINFFRDKMLTVDETERTLLANIIIEARRIFDCRLDDPYLQNMPLKESNVFGSQQMIKLYLTSFLIHLIRRYYHQDVISKELSKEKVEKLTRGKCDTEVFDIVTAYLEKHLRSHVTIEEICKDNLIGRSRLQKIIKDRCNLGVIEYFNVLKINAAKELIRHKQMNLTQISEFLGYSSIHYFSRQFKKVTNITASEYASSIKAMAEGTFS